MTDLYVFLLYLSCIGSTVHGQPNQFLRIYREKIHPEDDIQLPSVQSECPTETNPLCDKYNARKFDLTVNCLCQCNQPPGKYTFFEPNNSCIRVSEARQQAGCDLLFTDETVTGHITFFSPNGPNEPSKSIGLPTNKTCSFNFLGKLYVQYLDCAGDWKEVPSDEVKADWELTTGWATNQLQILVKRNISNFMNSTRGRIFRVAVQCRDLNSSNQDVGNSTCAMFKVEGGPYFCPFPQPASSGQSATLPPPTEEIINATGGTLRPPPTPTEQLSSQSTGSVTSEETPSPQTTTQTTPSTTTKGTTQGSPNLNAQTGTKRNTFIITGAVAGGILFIALIFLILWRCNNPKKRDPPHHRFEVGSISSPVSPMNRHSIPVYTDAAHLTPYGDFSMRTNSIENPAYRRASDGVVLGPQYRHGSLYSDSFPYGAPPRPPQGKGGSMNGQVNPALSMDDDVITMNPLYEGQVVDHRDLDELNCSDFAVYPEQIVLEDRKNPYGEEFDQTYDCPEEILNSKARVPEPVPVFYVLDDPYPESISSTFGHGENVRGRPDGNVYDEPEVDLTPDGSFIVMDSPSAVAYTRGYDDQPRGEDLQNRRRSQGILKVGSASPRDQGYYSQSSNARN
ncbi:unnamed protein product [Porites lobata]|uniref:Uncharacterized protein n=1 Tax=Porites lobata TaxID=104759 RepID=A0ABN8RQ11_9CNID|nr:unnamed protein product [Porites lobata]